MADYEVMNRYSLMEDGFVRAQQRTAVYLEPRDQLYFQAGGQAVAVYDYELEMRRVAAPADAGPGVKGCVQTPKGFTQCL